MDNLPSELITSIFQHIDKPELYTCSLLNRRFHAVVNPLLWRQLVNISPSDLFSLTRKLKSNPSLGQYIQQIRWDKDNRILPTDTQFLGLIKHTRNLKQLVLHCITSQQQQYLARYCPKLTHLSLYDGHGPFQMHSFTSLCQLELESCSNLDEGFFSALGNMPLLTDLKLINCHLTNNNNNNDDDDCLLLTNIPQFTRLTICLHEDIDTSPYITRMTNSWPDLVEFSLGVCPHITDEQIISFIKAHPHLLKMTLYAGQLTDRSLDAIATWLPQIKALGLFYNPQLTSKGIRHRLLSRCQALEKLDLLGCAISGIDFPEAKIACWKLENSHDSPVYLKHLDKPAILQIQNNNNKG